MAKTLKEALLEQMATLQERGLAPGEIPVEQEEEPSYAQYEGESERRGNARERDGEQRRAAGGRTPRSRPRTAAPRLREQRELREPRGGRERRPSRESRESREIPDGLVGPLPEATPRPAFRPSEGAPRPGFEPRPMGPPGQFRPSFGGARPAPRSDMLRRNAERIQREQADRSAIQELLTGYNGEEADDAAMEKFFSALAVETGALPPLNVVLEALRIAGNADPVEVGNQVRAYNRRSRSRAAPTPVGVS